jgi:predicted dithiol-disulfide oxidoreductase (DUF899 family)
MSETRYPNESAQYRSARDKLLEEERKLVEQTKAVAALRRQLPPGGELKEDYTFTWATADKLGQPVKLSELFGDKNTCSSTTSCSALAGTTRAPPARR